MENQVDSEPGTSNCDEVESEKFAVRFSTVRRLKYAQFEEFGMGGEWKIKPTLSREDETQEKRKRKRDDVALSPLLSIH